ncbi:MAG: energy transducer TonB [Dysgonamonadaceae bacterium]|jgi:TonB family protein|nr:energy transducer TonB [Dysgonamonadaceae bacterium]
MPEFPGGIAALMLYLSENIRYPVEAQKNGVQGRVFVRFVVGADGAVNHVGIRRSVSPELDDEAVRVVKTMPKWMPGKQNGENVAVFYILPIDFRLATDDDTPKEKTVSKLVPDNNDPKGKAEQEPVNENQLKKVVVTGYGG